MGFDLEVALVVATLLTGVIAAAEKFWLRPRRIANQQSASLEEAKAEMPVAVEYAVSFFPVLAIVLILRSFLFEPFHIPSGSMRPNLLVGDFILVNKYAYGVRLPVVHTKIIGNGKPERGDVIVFRHPDTPSRDYIKRLIGLPGDTVEYRQKQLFVNGLPAPQEFVAAYEPVEGEADDAGARIFDEDLLGVEHKILIHPQRNLDSRMQIPNCSGFDLVGDFCSFTLTVPDGQYFVMGDNRDNSADSRKWGMVPEANLIGRAMFVWMHFNLRQRNFNFGRIGNKIS